MPSEVDALITKVNKRLGSKVLRFASEIPTFQRVTTGSLSFDLALGGGWPLNCWNEIIGQESNGKTVMALKTLAANMEADPKYLALWVASEDYNKPWAESLGVDNSRVVLAPTNVMEEAYETMLDALESRAFDAIVLDSYPALVPTVESDNPMDEYSVGLGARLTNKLMRKSPPVQRREADERPCLALIINQWRDRIGVMFGDPRTTPGGKGKNFSYFIRVEVARDGWIERDKLKVGLNIKALVMKNKTAPPQRTGVTPFYFDDCPPFHQGEYDGVSQLFNIALTYDLISRQGAWYHHDGHRWNGKEKAIQEIGEDLDLRRQLDTEVRRLVLGIPIETSTPKRKVRRKT